MITLRHAHMSLSLRQRVFLVLLLALVLVQLFSFGAVGWSRGFEARHLANELIAQDIAHVHAQLLAQAPAERETLAFTLARAGYQWKLVARHDPADPIPVDAALAQLAQHHVLSGSLPSIHTVRWQGQAALRLPLDTGSDLLVVFPQGLPSSVPSLLAAITYIFVVTGAVTLAAWFAVSLATRPLAKAAEAARTLSADLAGPELVEQGPPEVQELTRSLNQLRHEVQRHLQAQTRVLAAVTHDLKTPITRLQLRVSALPEGDLRTRLQADLQAMLALVNEGLAFVGSESVQEPLRQVDLNAMIENLVEPLLDQGHACGYNPARLPAVHAAPRALTRLLQNLLDNALRYGGNADIEARVADGWVHIDVADRGPGLPPEDLERMFEPFIRGDPSRGRDSGGTGLGLAIARNLAQAHGGQLSLEARQGGGLVARLRWPQRPDIAESR